ncbi:hypothetical protein HDU79_009480 [Rhizoclosmatium sp. JEL0117]|nr:hypothetical protein HDU79_009480 [Rhizoclosmatium sp. JEL0117]
MKGDIEAAEHVLTVLCPKYGVQPTKPMYEKMIVWYMTHQRPRRPVGRIWSAADKGVADEELIFTDELKMFTNELEAMTEENAESRSNSPDAIDPESEPPIPTPPAQTLEAQELITEEMELKSIKRSHELFRLMIESGYKPEVTLFDVFMRSYYHRGEFDRVFELYETMKREKVSPDLCIYTILVETAAIGLNNLPKAFDLIREMTNRGPGFEVNLHILTILMNAHLQQNDLDSAKRIFQQILDTPTMKPSLHTYGTFVHTLCRAGETEEAHQLVTHEIPKLLKHPANVVLYNTLLHGYGCLAGNLTAATKVFQELVDTDQEPVVTTYNILISAHARHGEYKGAMKWYQALLEAKHRPTLVTYNIMIHMHLKQDDPLAAQEMYQKMVDSGIVPDMATTAPIVGYFSQRGDWKNVVKVIESSRQVSESSEVAHYFGKERGRVRYSEIVPHNVVLEQMRRNGNLAGVLRRFLEITGRDKELQDIGTSYHNKEGPVEKHNIEPDFRTYDILVRALANMNDLDSARYWFDDAIQRNIVDTRLVNTLMAFYLKAGQCQKAKEVYGLIDECGLVPDPVSVTLLFKANSNEKEDDENDESSANSLGGGA